MRYEVTEDIRLDRLTKHLMGKTGDGAVEALLAANPGLAAQGPIVAEGTEVEVPDVPTSTAAGFVRAWD